MKKGTKFTAILLALCLLMGMGSAIAEDKFVVGFANNNDVYDYCAKFRDYLKAACEAQGMEVIVTDAGGDTNVQNGQIDDMIVQDCKVISAISNDLDGSVPALEAARAAGLARLPRATPVEPPVPYPEDTLSYLANVFNHKARDFYARHGVKVIDAAYESHEEEGEVSLMITKHCVRYSMSLCPKQAKGVTGVQGTIRAEPLQLINGKERLTLRFDCKPCEMHVVGKIKRQVLNQAQEQPLTFYRARPTAAR